MAEGQLRAIFDAETKFKRLGLKDVNKNGIGEFGTLLDLKAGNKEHELITPAVFRSDDIGARDGLLFRIVVPSGTRRDPVSGEEALLAESLWWCYAWPKPGQERRVPDRVLLILPDGRLFASEYRDTGYQGPRGPEDFAGVTIADGSLQPLWHEIGR